MTRRELEAERVVLMAAVAREMVERFDRGERPVIPPEGLEALNALEACLAAAEGDQ